LREESANCGTLSLHMAGMTAKEKQKGKSQKEKERRKAAPFPP
jgi:hypothetical protein